MASKLNILYVNPGMKGATKTYRYYGGLYDELVKITNCQLAGDRNRKVDVVVFGRCFSNWSLRTKATVPILCILHKPENDTQAKIDFCNANVDVILHSVSDVKGFKSKRVLFKYGSDDMGFENELWYKYRIYDFGFSGALHKGSDDLRYKVQKMVEEQKDISSYLNGSDEMSQRTRDYSEYRKRMCQSKIWMATTGPGGDVGPRYYEVMASRALLFCNRVPNEYRDVFIDEQNCVEFDLNNFLPKLRHYLTNETERKRIVENAYRDFKASHTWSKRAEELCSIIRNMIATKNT